MPLLLKKNIIKGTVGKVRYYFRHASAMFPSSFYFLPVYPAKEKSDEVMQQSRKRLNQGRAWWTGKDWGTFEGRTFRIQ